MAMYTTVEGAGFQIFEAGAEYAVRCRNVSISSDTAVEKGMLLAGGYDGTDVSVHIATAADATNGNELYLAAESVEGKTVVTVFEAGVFLRQGIKLSEGLDIGTFEGELRRQHIWAIEGR